MLSQRIAMLADRLGLPMPEVLEYTRLGLAGAIKVERELPIAVAQAVHDQLLAEGIGDAFELADHLNQSHVWVWAEAKDGEGRWRWPGGVDTDFALRRASAGDIPDREFSLVLATPLLAVRCAPSRDGEFLRVFGVSKPRRAPCARLLLGEFTADVVGWAALDPLCQMVAAQSVLGSRARPKDLEREEVHEREFVSAARRYLEALRAHAVRAAPRADYELVERSPLRLRRADGERWPAGFTRPGAKVELPTHSGAGVRIAVSDVSDDGDVLDLEDVDELEVCERGELRCTPAVEPFKRMREALDILAMGTHEAHGRLLALLTRPEALAELPAPAVDAAGDRQDRAVALALHTPDIALIQGPPGTGKTTVICRIVEALVRKRLRVLLVAPTHVALDNVLERVGDRPGITALRLGAPEHVEQQARRFLLQHRAPELSRRLAEDLSAALEGVPPDDPVAQVQREWAAAVRDDEAAGNLLLLSANLVCATPIGIAMAREFSSVDVVFDVMIMDEASKATITDFLVPAARAAKWILVGDHMQLPPHVDVDELAAVIAGRIDRGQIDAPDDWAYELACDLRSDFDTRMHPDPTRSSRARKRLLDTLAAPLDAAGRATLAVLGPKAEQWRSALEEARRGEASPSEPIIRLGAELLELQRLALPSVFEHLTRLPASRTLRLDRQYRMAPALAAFSSQAAYGGDYPSAPETHALGLEIPSLEAPSIWIDTAFAPPHRRYEHPRDRDWQGGDYCNELECEVAIELVEVCAQWAVQRWRGDARGGASPFEIGVVCFYLQQALQLRARLFERLAPGGDPWRRAWGEPAANGAVIEIHVSVVDRFQGREKDVVILCTTRSNPAARRGHVDNLNRLNVAATRARHKRIVIGDSATLVGAPGRERPPTDLLRQLHDGCERKAKWGRALTRGAR